MANLSYFELLVKLLWKIFFAIHVDFMTKRRR